MLRRGSILTHNVWE